MEGFDIVLGEDWLDVVDPLIDWHSNRMYVKQEMNFTLCEVISMCSCVG